MNPHYNSYMAGIHTPAKKAAYGLHLFLSDGQPFRYVGISICIEPTEEIIRQAELQQEIDDINAESMGITYKHLFKKN